MGMEKHSKKSIRKLLKQSFSAMIILLVVSALASLSALFYVNKEYKFAMQNYGSAQGDVGKLGIEYQHSRSIVRDIIFLTNQSEVEAEVNKLNNSDKNLEELAKTVEKGCISQKEKDLYNEIIKDIEESKPHRQEVVNLGLEGKNQEALEMYRAKCAPISDEIVEHIDKLIEVNVAMSQKTTASAAILAAVMLVVISVLSIFSILFGITITKKLSSKICNSLDRIIAGANEIAHGNLKVQIDSHNDPEELRRLSDAFQIMTDNLNHYILQISNVTKDMAEYSLDTEIKGEFFGEFSYIKTSMNSIISIFNEFLGKIKSASTEVAEGSTQVAEGAQSLADGTTEEAGVIEELTATINDVSEKVNRNAQNVQTATGLTTKTQSAVDKGNTQMQEMITAMNEIQDNTNAIQAIVKSIEDISTQTNLLSLNAAIEAARAGEAGKGFAVVAGEIGSLAEQSSEATKDTISLIAKCIKASENGVKRVNDTAESLEEIVSTTTEAKKFMDEIAVASTEQAAALKEVVKGIDQVSEVMQSNSAISEESAATSEELTSQANLLSESVQRFKLKNS